MQRHMYQSPKGRMPRFVVPLIGICAALLVFLAIPLSQKLGDLFQPEVTDTGDDLFDADPPQEDMLEEETPPEEEEEEEPPEMAEESQELDTSLDLPSLDAGLGGGGMVLNLPKFNVKDDPNALFGSGDLDQPARAITKFPPQYPPAMRRKGGTGRVVILIHLDTKGNVTQSSIKNSSGHDALDRSAERAVRKWRFKPGMKGGRAVRSKILIPVNFKLNR